MYISKIKLHATIRWRWCGFAPSGKTDSWPLHLNIYFVGIFNKQIVLAQDHGKFVSWMLGGWGLGFDALDTSYCKQLTQWWRPSSVALWWHTLKWSITSDFKTPKEPSLVFDFFSHSLPFSWILLQHHHFQGLCPVCSPELIWFEARGQNLT